MNRLTPFITVFLLLCILFSGCGSMPPDKTDVYDWFTNNRDDVEIVANYLKGIDGEYASVFSNSGRCYYDLSAHEIEIDSVRASIKRLWRNGCEYISMERNSNTIWFQLWHRKRGSLDCGVACTVSGSGNPQAEFQIKSEELEIGSGWFYYYSDYEEYRVNRNRGDV